MHWAVLLAPEAASQELDILSLIVNASGVVLGVLGLLAFFSLVSWYIIGYKYFYLRRAHRDSLRFLDQFWTSKRLDAIYQHAQELKRSPLSALFRAGYVELGRLKSGATTERDEKGDWLGDLQSIERALARAQTSEMTHLESMIPFLATTGSAAPFVGLFGTVWGIMNSFRSIGAKGAANLATVAPGIAEALVATAIGLMAAIPAVMAYNYFTRRVKVLSAEMDAFGNDFLNIIKRHFFK
ncbi:MAG: protein TolQ [Deltaproteobacteria bacterium]|nr:protein TolQ [Deltaproteobacteria bacterium]